MKHIEFMKEDNYPFQLNIKGIVICNTKLDWAMEWYKYDREKRNKRMISDCKSLILLNHY